MPLYYTDLPDVNSSLWRDGVRDRGGDGASVGLAISSRSRESLLLYYLHVLNLTPLNLKGALVGTPQIAVPPRPNR